MLPPPRTPDVLGAPGSTGSFGRPRREFTAADREAIRHTPTLTQHRMRYLGLFDPVPNASPMSEDEGAWVREHVWPPFLRVLDDAYPWGFWRWSLCERGTCWNCIAGRCEWCVHRQQNGPAICTNTESVHNHHGRHIAKFTLRPGGEPCGWWCRCPCAKTDNPVPEPALSPGAPLPPASDGPTRGRKPPAGGGDQVPLPGL